MYSKAVWSLSRLHEVKENSPIRALSGIKVLLKLIFLILLQFNGSSFL